MRKKLISILLVIIIAVGVMPLSALSALANEYSSGKGDTASYYMKVLDTVGSNVPSYSNFSEGLYSRAVVKSGEEVFIPYSMNTSFSSCAYDCIRPVLATYGSSYIDAPEEELEAVNYLAWRIKVEPGDTKLGMTILAGYEGSSFVGWLITDNAIFIDKSSREPVKMTHGGLYSVFFSEQGFDGWMFVDLNKPYREIFDGYSKTVLVKDYLLGITGGEEKTDANAHSGKWQYFFHRDSCGHTGVQSDWTDRSILIGDILMVESLDAFKSVHVGCNQFGHESKQTEVIKAPTCQSKGIAKVVCMHCGTDMGTEEIPEAHNYELSKIDPTLTEQGYTLHTCITCGVSYKDSFIKAGSVKENLLIGMYQLPDHPSTTFTDEEYLSFIEATFKEGYVNTVTTNGKRCFREMLALYKKYNIKFWLFTELYNSERTTIPAFLNGVEKYVNIIREEDAWDLFMGFHWDEPAQNHQKGDDFLAMTKALFEKWGKRNYPVFAIAAFLKEYYGSGERTTEFYETRHYQYVTDAGWDIYHYDLRKEAESNINQQRALAYESSKYGEYFATAMDYYRFVQRRLSERIGHEFSAWFYPSTWVTGVSTGGESDEGFMVGQMEGFNQLLSEQPNPGGLMTFTFTSYKGPGMEARLPIRDDEGNIINFPEVEKYYELADVFKGLKEQYDNTYVYLPDVLEAGTIDISEITETSITLNPVYNYIYSMDGETWIEGGKLNNLTPATAYTIIAKKISTGETREFTISTRSYQPYVSGLQDTASYIVKLPTDTKYAAPGWVGQYVGRLSDDSDWKYDYYGVVHYKEFDNERFLEIYKQAGYDDNLYVKLGFGDDERTVDKGFSEKLDSTRLSGFALRVKTTGGDESVQSSFTLYINELYPHTKAYYYIDKNGNITENKGSIKITKNIDGWIIIPFDSFATAEAGKTNREWFSENIIGLGYYFHDENCRHGEKSSWGERKLYFGDMMVYENLDLFKCARFELHEYLDGKCKFCGEADPDAPAIVTKAELKVDSQTNDTISVSWNDVTGVNDYYIQITDKLTGSLVRVVRAQNTNATSIYGLTAGTEYLLSICAYTPGKPAVYEEAIDAKTSGFAPLGLTATEKGAEVELNWNKPANAVAYYCYILKDGQTIRAAGVQNPEQTTFTFMLPKEAGSYTFGIIAATFDGVKNVYWDMQTTTQPIVVAVNNPTLSVVSKTTDSLTLGWDAIGGVSDYYIQIVNKETGALVRVARAQNTTSTTIYGLTAGTDYLLSICAYTPGRPAVYSEPIEAQTESHSELNLTATQKGNEVELNWNKPANAIAYYVYILKDGETIRAAGVQDPNQTTFTFMMPIGKGSYTFGIIAATNNGAQNIYSPMQVTPDAIVVA